MTTLIDRAAPQGELDSFLSAFSGAAAEAEGPAASPSAPPRGESGAAVVTAPPEARGDNEDSLFPEAGKYREDAADWASNIMAPGACGLAAPDNAALAAANGHQQNAASPAQPPLLIDEEMTRAASSELTKRQRKPTWKLQSPGLDGGAIAQPSLLEQQNAIQPTDMLFGHQISHAGTDHVKMILDALALESYESLRRAGRIQEFVAGVISYVHSQGGRFLQKVTGGWVEVDDAKARSMLSGRLVKRNRRSREAQSRLGAVSMAAAAASGGTGATPAGSPAMPIRGEEPKSIGGAMDFATGCFSPPQSSYFVQGNDVLG